MKTLAFYKGTETDIVPGLEVYFGQLWDGEGDGQEILESGAVSPDGESVVSFEVIEADDDPMESRVRVTDIY